MGSDNKRINQFYLVDQHGKEHLAIVGTERETRDAHYTYATVRVQEHTHIRMGARAQARTYKRVAALHRGSSWEGGW